MITENQVDLDQAAFNAGFSGESLPAQDAPAAVEEPAQAAADASTEQPQEAADEYAGLSPKVREQLAKLESLERAASLIPTLEHRLRSAEGRVASLQKQVPAPTPPAPPRLEKVEAVRGEFPEMIDAMEEMLAHRLQKEAEKPTEQTDAQQVEDPAETPTPILDAELPNWQEMARDPAFDQWLAAQGAQYRTKVRTSDNEAVFLAALTRFDDHRKAAVARSDAAQRASQTRQARTTAAVTPNTAGRREPATATLESAFEQGFNARR